MANINEVQVFANKYLGKEFNSEEHEVAMAKVKELCKDPSPENRYRIMEVMVDVIDTVIKQKLDYLEKIADVKRVPLGTAIQFNVKLEGIKAYIQAVGSTTQRSQVVNKQVTLAPVEVSARPHINFAKMANGQQTMADVIDDAIVAMEDKIAYYTQTVMYATYSGLSSPFYATGAGFVTATFNPMLFAIMKFGQATITGDIEAISKVLPDTTSDNMIDTSNSNGFIGSYKGANILKLENKFTDYSMATTELDKSLIYILPTGRQDLRPLKVGFEGGVRAMEQINIDDESWEIVLRQNFAVTILTDKKMMAVYEDENL